MRVDRFSGLDRAQLEQQLAALLIAMQWGATPRRRRMLVQLRERLRREPVNA